LSSCLGILLSDRRQLGVRRGGYPICGRTDRPRNIGDYIAPVVGQLGFAPLCQVSGEEDNSGDGPAQND
jgi:hypothetical protein